MISIFLVPDALSTYQNCNSSGEVRGINGKVHQTLLIRGKAGLVRIFIYTDRYSFIGDWPVLLINQKNLEMGK